MRLYRKIGHLFGYELINIKKRHPTLETHLPKLFDALAINCVIDVGANKGQFGTMLREMGYQGLIHSFEPLEETFSILQHNVKGNWRTYNFALGSENKTLAIHQTKDDAFSSFLTPNPYSKNRFYNSVPIKKIQEVTVKKLDNVFDELLASVKDPKVFLKLDTQGYDLEVLKGATKSLKRIVGLQSEVSTCPLYDNMPDYLESLTMFKDLGFEITGLFPISRDYNTMQLIEFDCVMRKSAA